MSSSTIELPYTNSVEITAGTPVQPGQAVAIEPTSAGRIKLILASGGMLEMPIPAIFTIFSGLAVKDFLIVSGGAKVSVLSVGPSSVEGTPPPVLVVPPAISGTLRAGQDLTVPTGSWSDTPTSYTYQWRRNGAAILGATTSSYTLLPSDVGTLCTVTVTAKNAGGSRSFEAQANQVTQAAAGSVDLAPVNRILPEIRGQARVGQSLSVSPGVWFNSPTSFTYTWQANGVTINGAFASSYTVSAEHQGKDLTVLVTAVNANGSYPVMTDSVRITAPIVVDTIPSNTLIDVDGTPLVDVDGSLMLDVA